MIAYRFQAWKFSPRRAGEFRRTCRSRALPRAGLTRRWVEREDDVLMRALWLERPDRHRPPRAMRRARPESRTAVFVPYYAGPIRCVAVSSPRARPRRSDDFYLTHPDHHRPPGRPPASIAAHRLEAWGYASIPF